MVRGSSLLGAITTDKALRGGKEQILRDISAAGCLICCAGAWFLLLSCLSTGFSLSFLTLTLFLFATSTLGSFCFSTGLSLSFLTFTLFLLTTSTLFGFGTSLGFGFFALTLLLLTTSPLFSFGASLGFSFLTFTLFLLATSTLFSFSTGLNMLYFDYDEKMLERDAPQLIADIKTRINALNPDFLGTQEYRDLCLEVKQAALNSVKILEERVMPKIQRDAFSDANSTFTTEVYPELARAISACSALYKIQTQHCLSLTQAASDSTIVFVDSILTVVGVIMALICAFFMSNIN